MLAVANWSRQQVVPVMMPADYSFTGRKSANDVVAPSDAVEARSAGQWDVTAADWLDVQSCAASEAALRHALSKVFSKVSCQLQLAIDPEEDWRRPLLVVSTGIEDLDERLALEDEFYSLVAEDPELVQALRTITVQFT